MKNLTTKTLFILVIVMLFSQISRSQNLIESFALNPKSGFYIASKYNKGFIIGMEANLSVNKLVFSIDHLYSEEFVLFSDSPHEFYRQIGLMIGKKYGRGIFQIQLTGGLAPIWGRERTELIEDNSDWLSGDLYDTDKFTTVGLVTKVGIKIIPLRFLSIGMDLQTNINPKKSMFMPMLSIEFGQLRSKN